jgi:hypothetical protein
MQTEMRVLFMHPHLTSQYQIQRTCEGSRKCIYFMAHFQEKYNPLHKVADYLIPFPCMNTWDSPLHCCVEERLASAGVRLPAISINS